MDDYMPDERSNNYNRQGPDLEDAIPRPNLSSLEAKDPSLEDGFKLLYNKEVPLDIKLEFKEGTKDIASYEPITCKLLSDNSSKDGTPAKVKIELSWENDLLFHYTNIVDEQTFLDMKKKQELNIDFPDYCDLIIKIFENCINSPDTFIGALTIHKDGISKLNFVKSSDFKFLELISLEFKNSPDEVIQKHMLYRFAYLKAKLDYNKKAIKAAGDVILDCNPEVMQPILESNDNYNLNINKFFGNNILEKNKEL